MSDRESGLSIEELAERVGVPVRTIRYYISEGLLPGPGARGWAASYSEEHLLRLRLVRLLSERRVPLVNIREQLQGLSMDELRELLIEEERRALELARARQAGSPKEYIATLLKLARAGSEIAPSGTRSDKGARPEIPASRPDVPSETWQRWKLAPGVELHVRVDALDRYRRLVEGLLRLAGRGPDRWAR